MYEKFIQYIKQFKVFNLKNEFIRKLFSLYLTFEGKTSSFEEEIDIKVLWRWIKYLVRNINNKLGVELIKNNEKKTKTVAFDHDYNDISFSQLNNNSSDNFYQNLCQEIMKEYNLKDIKHFKKFIFDLFNKNFTNKQRVERIKRLLFTGI